MAELYLFTKDGVNYGFTPGIFKQTFDSVVYQPTVIRRKGLKLTNNFQKSLLSIEFEKSNSFAFNLISEIAEVPILVKIYKNGAVYWQGRVLETILDAGIITLNCDSIYSTMIRVANSPKMTRTCRHVIYSEGCGVSQSLWGVNYTCTANSSLIPISGITQPAGYFDGGIAVMDNQKRKIVKQTTADILITPPFTEVKVGQITLYPGCKLTEDNCTLFNNLVNFGGFSRMPIKNPFSNTGLL